MSTLLTHYVDQPIRYERKHGDLIIHLTLDVGIQLLARDRGDTYTPAEREARATAIKLRELAVEVQAWEMDHEGETPPVSVRALEELAIGLEREL